GVLEQSGLRLLPGLDMFDLDAPRIAVDDPAADQERVVSPHHRCPPRAEHDRTGNHMSRLDATVSHALTQACMARPFPSGPSLFLHSASRPRRGHRTDDVPSVTESWPCCPSST